MPGVQEHEVQVEAMAEKCTSETQEQELDYCTSSNDDSDIVNTLDLHEMVLDGEAELILSVSRKVRMISWCSIQFLKLKSNQAGFLLSAPLENAELFSLFSGMIRIF